MIQKVGVIGAGQMGNGIAHVSSLAGYDVKLVDVDKTQLDKAKSIIDQNMGRQIKRGTIKEADKTAALGRITVGTEYALLGGWSVKSEFLYADFGTLHYGDEPGLAVNCVTGCPNADVKMHEYIWRVGMNYRFHWASFGKGKAPVVAKY